jgi:hypothetical protein
LNAKTFRKLLMRSRSCGLARVAIRLPVSIVPEPMPPSVTFEGMRLSEYNDGTWESQDGKSYVFITKAWGSHKPETDCQCDRNDDGSWSWEGIACTDIVGEDGQVTTESTPIDEATIAQHAADREWHERLWHGGVHPALDAIHNGSTCADGWSVNAHGPWLYLSFYVKVSRRWAVLGLSSRMARAVRRVKAMGVDVRVMKGVSG